jgi:Tol biopolymer transport system component
MKITWRRMAIVGAMLLLVGCRGPALTGQIMVSEWGRSFLIYDASSGELEERTDGGMRHAWSPDGHWLAYLCRPASTANICIREYPSSESRPLLDESGEVGPGANTPLAWTRDSNGVTFFKSHSRRGDGGTVYTVDRQTGALTELFETPTELGEPTSLAWLTDTKLLVGLRGHSSYILVWDTETAAFTLLGEGKYPGWSTHRRRIVFLRSYYCLSEEACFTESPDSYGRFSFARSGLYTMDEDGRREKPLYEISVTPVSPHPLEPRGEPGFCPSYNGLAWSPDGRYIAFINKCREADPPALYVLEVATGRLILLDREVPLLTNSISWVPVPQE